MICLLPLIALCDIEELYAGSRDQKDNREMCVLEITWDTLVIARSKVGHSTGILFLSSTGLNNVQSEYVVQMGHVQSGVRKSFRSADHEEDKTASKEILVEHTRQRFSRVTC